MEKGKILWIFMGVFVLLYPVLGLGKDYYLNKIPYGDISSMTLNVRSQESAKPIGEIIDGSVVRQSFAAGKKRIRSIKLSGATYDRKNQGILAVSLIDADSKEPLENWDIDVSELEDNAYFELDIKNDYGISGKKYVLEITARGAFPGNAVTLYACPENAYPDGEFSMNGKRQKGDLCFQIFEAEKRSYLHTKVWLRIYASVAAGSILYAVYKTGGKRVRKGCM